VVEVLLLLESRPQTLFSLLVAGRPPPTRELVETQLSLTLQEHQLITDKQVETLGSVDAPTQDTRLLVVDSSLEEKIGFLEITQ
jgi:hypothetical protein